MKLNNCLLDGNVVITGPLQITAPREDWVEAHKDRAIPDGLYELYTRADYLSFGSAQGFLADQEHVLFGYFSMLLRSTKELCIEAREKVDEFEKAMAASYNPGKKLRGEKWDRTADKRARRAFKYLAVTLSGTLDALADVIALFFTSRIPRLRLGRAQFARVEEWLDEPLEIASLVVSPQEHYLGQIYHVLRPIVFPSGPDKHWLPLLRLLRNKSAHMGDRIFPFIGLHDRDGTFYEFFPRQWPYILESHISHKDSAQIRSQTPMQPHLEEVLMHQDVISFSKGLCLRVSSVVEETCKILTVAYAQFRTLPVNDAALQELNGSAEAFEFEFFPETEEAADDRKGE
jgi:hypothetical protein